MKARERLKRAKRIVVKVGTSTLLYDTGKLNYYRIEHIVRELSDLASRGLEVILVSSGAVGTGLVRMGMKKRPASMKEKQAISAVGQTMLMHIYDKFFMEYGQTVGQVLLTKDNAVNHKQYINSRNTLLTMLKMGLIPVINENDAVTIDEIKIGDNDTLSAIVASIVDADLLIILSDIDGVYTANPQTHPDAQLIDMISEITPEIEQLAGGAGSSMGTGGMSTKIEAAKIATASGVTMVIAPGDKDGIIRGLVNGEAIGTIFPPKESHLRARKGWLAFGKRIGGSIVVDDGCVKALCGGASLLAAGIISTDGEYEAGNTVRILSAAGREVARGIINYDSVTIDRIKGMKTADFADLVNGELHEEVIHRDNLVLML